MTTKECGIDLSKSLSLPFLGLWPCGVERRKYVKYHYDIKRSYVYLFYFKKEKNYSTYIFKRKI